MTRRRSVVLLLVLLSTIPAPGRAQPRASTPSRARAPHVHRALADVLTSGAATVEQALRAQRELLTAPVERGGSGLRGAPLESARGSKASHVLFGTLQLAALDVDGNGRDEVLTLRSEALGSLVDLVLNRPQPASLELRRGEDGAVLWSAETLTSALATTMDTDGDGLPEIVVFDRSGPSLEPPALYVYARAARMTERIRVLDARTGAQAWARSTKSTMLVGVAGAFVYAQLYEYRDVIDRVVGHGDADGDGRSDLHVSSFDYTQAGGVGLVGAGAGLWRDVATTLRGLDGSEIAVAKITGPIVIGCALLCAIVNGIPTFLPADDADGDGRADLLLIHGPEPVMQKASARSIDGERIIWEDRTFLDTRFGYPAFVQLNGTGPRDIIFEASWDWRALDGATGEELWRETDTWSSPTEDVWAGDIDGDGATDSIVFGYLDSDYEQRSLIAQRGSDRSILWSQTFARGEEERFTWGSCGSACLGDLDADGLKDAVAVSLKGRWVIDEECDCEQFTYVGSRAIAVSAASGSVLYDVSVDEPVFNATMLGQDVTGDGSADLFQYGAWHSESDAAGVREGATFQRVFEVPHGDDEWIWSVATAALTLDAGHELLASYEMWGDTGYWFTVAAYDGPTLIWTA